MSKIGIVYWTGTGNTGAMAEAIVDGVKAAGGSCDLVNLSDGPLDVTAYDTIAFGCPAMGAEELEETEFEPYFASVEDKLAGKNIGLFGSYSWADGEWMDLWKARCEENGLNVLATLIAYDMPDDDAIAECKAFGEKLAKA